MFERQNSLPRLPVPPLHQTIERYLDYVKGLVSESEFAATSASAVDFAGSSVAQQLQAYLVEKAQDPHVPNWLDRWWADAYLKDRSPPTCYSSPAVALTDHPLPEVNRNRTLRAALLLKYTLEFKEMICKGTVPVDTVRGQPLCMMDYTRLFNCTRVPLPGRDRIETFPESRHIVVLKRGHVFSVDVLDRQNNTLDVSALYGALVKVEKEAAQPPSDGISLAALTALKRDAWANVRGRIIASSAANHATLARIESAIMVLTLDDGAPEANSTDMLWFTMFGLPPQRHKGSPPSFCNRWGDKSFQVHVAENGRAGVTFEHSAMDSLPPLQWSRHVTLRQMDRLHGEEDIAALPSPSARTAPFRRLSLAAVGDGELLSQATAAGIQAFRETISSLDMAALTCQRNVGAKRIKALGVSPDGFVQMLLQATFKKLRGYTPSTYESASTKQFLHGRTETLRTVTQQSKQFVDAFLREPPDPVDVRRTLLAAVKAHGASARACSMGQSCDRHLYGLLCAARELNVTPLPPLFSDPSFVRYMTIELSTTHPFAVPGSRHVCFGPVSAKCIGVGYFALPDELIFGISSWQHGEPQAFATSLKRNLDKLLLLLERSTSKL